MASSQNLTFSQWILQGSGWQTSYTASASISVSRAYGSDTASVTVNATMTTLGGDSNTLGWKCWVQLGGTWQSFDVAPTGVHYQNSSYSATQTFTPSVSSSAGTLTGSIKFQICGFEGYTGEYSSAESYSIDYGSKGPSELTGVTNRYYGYASTFSINRLSSGFREQVTMTNGSTTLTIKTTSTADASFSYTLDRSNTPNTTKPSSSTWTISVATYSGSTLIGTNSYSYSWQINSNDTNYAPTLSSNPTTEAYNDVISALSTDTAVAGYSKINVKAAKSAVSLKYSATISSRVVTFSNGSSASADQTNHISSVINSAGTVTWTYVVTDSRGYSVSRTGSYNVIGYNAPVISATVYRGNSSGTAQDDGAYIFVTATATYDSLGSHNSVTLKANVDGGTDTTLTSGTRTTLKTNADASTSYTINVKATDLIQTVTKPYKVFAKDLPLNIAVNGKGVGIGEKAVSDSTLRIGYGTKFDGDTTYTGTTSIKYQGTKATYSMIKFKDNTSDTYGNGIVIGGGGLTIVGGGEAADTTLAQYSTGGSETLELVNDGSVYIRSNLNNGWSSRKDFVFNTSGYIETPLGVDKVYGRYTSNGGVQPPNYFGKNTVGFLMSNVSVNSDSHYKNIMYMDCYNGDDVGGVTALALDRTEARAFIMQSDKNRTSWNNSTELVTHAQCSTATTANTVVKRDGNGYIKAAYFNSTNSVDNSNYSTSSNIVYNNSDGYYRKCAFNSAAPVTAITSKVSNVVIDEGSYARFGRIIVVTMRFHSTSNTGTRTYFADLPTPVAPCGVQGISYSTGSASGCYYYLGTNGSGISNIGTLTTGAQCVTMSYVAAS